MVTATMMMKSKMVSLYISWPTRVSQHCGQQQKRQTETQIKIHVQYITIKLEGSISETPPGIKTELQVRILTRS